MKNLFASWFWIVVPLIFAGVLYGFHLSRLPLEDADEATYAMVVREMMASGHYATLTLFGKPWIDKPPLLFWSMAASAKIFGLNEFALRLPEALFGIIAVALTVGIIWEFTRKKEPAFIGGLFLVFLPLFLAAARNVRMDVPVTAAILAAFYLFLKGRRDSLYLIGFGVSVAIGFLLKSVITLLVIPLLFFYGIFYDDWGWIKDKYFWIGNTLGLLLALPWHLYEASILGTSFLWKYFGFQIGRVAQNIIQSQITSGYVVWVFWKYGQPLSAIFLAAFGLYAIFFLQREREPAIEIKRFFTFSSFSLVSFIFMFGIFLLPTTKLVTYFIPSYPFFSIFIASVYEMSVLKLRPVGQNILRTAMIFILGLGLFFSIREAFFESNLYVTKQTVDSKQIGIYLSTKPPAVPIYLYEYPSDQTIQYYSQRSVTHFTEEKNARLMPPFFLIIPTELLAENQWLDKFHHLYQGDYLTLVDIE